MGHNYPLMASQDPSPPQPVPPLPPPSTGADNMALLSLMDPESLVSLLETKRLVEERRTVARSCSMGAEQGGQHGSMPVGLVARLATKSDLEAEMGGEGPQQQPPEMPFCNASDLKVPQSYGEAMSSEYAHLWGHATTKEMRGLVDGGAFKEV